jgi:hypothetical protein
MSSRIVADAPTPTATPRPSPLHFSLHPTSKLFSPTAAYFPFFPSPFALFNFIVLFDPSVYCLTHFLEIRQQFDKFQVVFHFFEVILSVNRP